jgi:hypothetical protein
VQTQLRLSKRPDLQCFTRFENGKKSGLVAIDENIFSTDFRPDGFLFLSTLLRMSTQAVGSVERIRFAMNL